MIAEYLEPIGLAADAEPIADFRAMASMKADAQRGSSKLLMALLRSQRPKKAPKRRISLYGTSEERRLAASQIGRLQEVVSGFYGISSGLLTGSRGPKEVSEKRQVAMYLARQVIQSSLPDIAKQFGRKDHTTVLHACRVVESDPRLAADAAAIRERIGA